MNVFKFQALSGFNFKVTTFINLIVNVFHKFKQQMVEC